MGFLVKNPPAMWETWVRSLGWEDHLEKRMATNSSIFAWRMPWTEEPGMSIELQRVRHDWVTFTLGELINNQHFDLQNMLSIAGKIPLNPTQFCLFWTINVFKRKLWEKKVNIYNSGLSLSSWKKCYIQKLMHYSA